MNQKKDNDMILHIQIWDDHAKKHVFHQLDEVSVANSFVPNNMWIISAEDEKVVYKVQQCLTVKHAVDIDGELYESFISGVLILEAGKIFGEYTFLAISASTMVNGDYNVGINTHVESHLDYVDEFKVVDLTPIPRELNKDKPEFYVK